MMATGILHQEDLIITGATITVLHREMILIAEVLQAIVFNEIIIQIQKEEFLKEEITMDLAAVIRLVKGQSAATM